MLNLIHIFLDIFFVQNRVIRLSKGLKEKLTENDLNQNFEPKIEVQSFNLTAKLHLTVLEKKLFSKN